MQQVVATLDPILSEDSTALSWMFSSLDRLQCNHWFLQLPPKPDPAVAFAAGLSRAPAAVLQSVASHH